MEIHFYAVPNYVCTGVVERYFKLSVVFMDSDCRHHVFSVIINRKTNRLEHQAKMDRYPSRKRKIDVLGYGPTPYFALDMDDLNDKYPTWTDESKTMLDKCAMEIGKSINMGMAKIRNNPAFNISLDDLQELGKWHTDFIRNVKSIEYGTFKKEDTEAQSVEEPVFSRHAVEEKTDNNESAVTPAEVDQLKRKTIKMARINDAEGMYEFVKGNIYKVDLNRCTSFGGCMYVSIFTDNGEQRYIRQDRIRLVDQFDEPPTN